MVSESGADEAALFKSYSNLQDINPELAKQMLKEAKEIMEPLGVPFFFDRVRVSARSETRPSSPGTMISI